MIDLEKLRQAVMRGVATGDVRQLGDVMEMVQGMLERGKCKSIGASQFENEKTHVHFEFKVVTDDWYTFGFDIFNPVGITLYGVKIIERST